MQTVLGWIGQQSGTLVVGAIGMVLLAVLFFPVLLRFAGLSGQQIIDVLQLTVQFCLSLISELRDNNKTLK